MKQSTKRNVVYLAGKVGGPKWEMVRYLDESAAEFVASDGDNHSNHLWGACSFSLSAEGSDSVADLALKPIEHSDFLVAYMEDETSYGSIAEIAWASAKGIPCYILARGNDFTHDAYWFVSNFPGVVGMWVTDIVEAACVVDNLLKIESPIEKIFYDTAMLCDPILATSLIAQHKVPTPDFTYRVDFMLLYSNSAVAIELDGHDYHKSVEQRTHDARKDRFMQSKGISVVRFTGTEITRDPAACVKEISKMIDHLRPNSDEDRRFEFLGPSIYAEPRESNGDKIVDLLLGGSIPNPYLNEVNPYLDEVNRMEMGKDN